MRRRSCALSESSLCSRDLAANLVRGSSGRNYGPSLSCCPLAPGCDYGRWSLLGEKFIRADTNTKASRALIVGGDRKHSRFGCCGGAKHQKSQKVTRRRLSYSRSGGVTLAIHAS